METPKTILRFFSNPKYAINCINEKRLTLIKAKKFNDPFDPNLFFEPECTDPYKFVDWIKENHPEDYSEFQKEEKRFVDIFPDGLKHVQEHLKTLRNKYFACCFIEGNKRVIRENLYMWGHYAKSHESIAIEFNSHKLVDSIIKNRRVETNDILHKINYMKKPRKISNEALYQFLHNEKKETLSEEMNAYFLSKSSFFRNEKEWRIAAKNTNTKLDFFYYDFDECAINAIYLGCNCDNKWKDEIIASAKNRKSKMKIFIGEPDYKNFKIKFRHYN